VLHMHGTNWLQFLNRRWSRFGPSTHLHADITIAAVHSFLAWLRPVSASWRIGQSQQAVRNLLRERTSLQLQQFQHCLVKVRVPFLLPSLLRISDAMGKRTDNDLNAANTTASVQASRRWGHCLQATAGVVPCGGPRCWHDLYLVHMPRRTFTSCLKPPPLLPRLQVLGVGTDTGTSVPSVLLFFDRQRFLFNAGEGFQRFCVEHRIKLAKVSGVLATRTTTEATGGLPGTKSIRGGLACCGQACCPWQATRQPSLQLVLLPPTPDPVPTGMLLTMADTSCGGLLAGHAGMSLYGPPGLNTLVNAFRTFVNVRDIGLRVHEFGADADVQPVLQSDLVAITAVTLQALGGEASGAPAAAGGEEGGEPGAKRARLDPGDGGLDVASVSVESPAACYICELPAVPGKFLPQKVGTAPPLRPTKAPAFCTANHTPACLFNPACQPPVSCRPRPSAYRVGRCMASWCGARRWWPPTARRCAPPT
jgi:hypothetical protein